MSAPNICALSGGIHVPEQLPARMRSVRPADFTRVSELAHGGHLRYDGKVPKSQAKVETKQERAEREARERLENADMNLFDRFMKKLIGVPTDKTEASSPKRGASDHEKDDSSVLEKNKS
jgi:hypothetical protein